MVCSRSPSDGLGIPLPDFKGVRIRNHDRSGDRINGWVGPSSTREITASLGRGSRGTVQRSDNDDRVLSLSAGELLRPAWGEEPKTRATKERSSTALRSQFHYGARGGLSRVEMNALRRALDSPPGAHGDLSSFFA